MSVNFAGQISGNFISNGESFFIPYMADISKVEVFNSSVGNDAWMKFIWYKGMTNGRGFRYQNSANGVWGEIAENQGIWTIDKSVNPLGARQELTNITDGDPPVLQKDGNAVAPVVGDIVRVYDTATARQISTVDFEVTDVDNNDITLGYAAQLAAASGAGHYAIQKYLPMFYPSKRYISEITQATQATIRFTVRHEYVVGQRIKFRVPDNFGMSQINNLEGVVVAIPSASQVTVDIDTTGFTAYAWPADSVERFTFAHAYPAGGNTAESINSNVNPLGTGSRNDAERGVLLTGGANLPAGANNDVVYYTISSSF